MATSSTFDGATVLKQNVQSTNSSTDNSLNQYLVPKTYLLPGEEREAATIATPLTPNHWEMQRTDSGESVIKVTLTPTAYRTTSDDFYYSSAMQDTGSSSESSNSDADSTTFSTQRYRQTYLKKVLID